MARRTGLTWLLAAVLVVAAAGLGGWALLRNGTGCRLAAEGTCQRVLFIGNSYTSVNDLPAVYAALVRSGGGAVETAMIAPGGAFLSDQAADPAVAAAIAGTPWTAVIIQEQSMAPASRAVRESSTIPGAVALVGQAMGVGARPYLLETWAHRDGWPEMGMDEPAMQAAISQGYTEVGGRAGVPVVRAGTAWQRALSEAPSIALWQPDGSHPTGAGTYLAACVLYRALNGRSPAGLAETGGLSASDAATLQRIADEGGAGVDRQVSAGTSVRQHAAAELFDLLAVHEEQMAGRACRQIWRGPLDGCGSDRHDQQRTPRPASRPRGSPWTEVSARSSRV